ncbi:uncharacterized protein LOC135349671 isoform X2 [Halichondria panicea]|uniref:uncharacterized protein LOC135349671 isoform X2 n=1 Tax=Halichondria panicea TaxID=6063 RepID=UPI00312BC592
MWASVHKRILNFILLLGELSGVSGCDDRVSSLLPLCAETLRHRHYPQHINLLETLLKLSSDNAWCTLPLSGLSHLTLSAAGEDDPQRENRTTQSNVNKDCLKPYVGGLITKLWMTTTFLVLSSSCTSLKVTFSSGIDPLEWLYLGRFIVSMTTQLTVNVLVWFTGPQNEEGRMYDSHYHKPWEKIACPSRWVRECLRAASSMN